jgi:DNA-binding response OmpR family regulator
VTPRLRLDPGDSRTLVGENEVRLSGTEYRLLALLAERSPREVSLEQALRGIWGQSAVNASVSALRAQVPNLRARLAGAGLRDVVQSRRGRGSALVLP